MPSRPVVAELNFRPRHLAMRTLDERLAIRFPRVLGFVADRITRLPVRSRIRHYLIARRTCQGFQAVNRGDLDLLLAVYHEDVTTVFDASGEFVPPGLAGEHRGRDGFKRLFGEWRPRQAALLRCLRAARRPDQPARNVRRPRHRAQSSGRIA
jgi:hypothetical protein